MNLDIFTAKLGGLPQQIKKMVLRQFIVATIIFLLLVINYSMALGMSLLIGFGSVIGGFLLAFPIAKTNIKGQPAPAVMVKLLFIIITLWAAFKFYDDIQPFGLVLGLAISALMSGLAISKLDKN
jgi:ATP synthase protein I